MDTTPVSLLEQLKKPQPQAAWKRFAELYTPLLYFWARSQGLNEADAADLVQEVFLLLVAKLPHFQYDRDGSFRSWLRTLTLNKHRELLRRKRPNLVDNLQNEPAKNSDSSLEEKEYRLQLVQQLLRIVEDQFPPSTWQIFQEYVIENRDPREIAAKRKVTLGTVYAAKSKVLQRLRRDLAGLLD
jgi:RNA polymerase sigma-70 factor (ECF subfamily)